MATNKEILKIREGIYKWDQIRNTDLALNFLTSGIGFSIDKDSYESWKSLEDSVNGETIKNIHVYIGVMEFETTFFLVDSLTDARGKTDPEVYILNRNLFTKGFTKNMSYGFSVNQKLKKVPNILFPEVSDPRAITEKEALERLLKWMLYSDVWFESRQKSKPSGEEPFPGVLKCMTIPFSDLDYLFSDAGTEEVYAFFALREADLHGKPLDVLELILCNQTFNSEGYAVSVKHFADVTRPRPPFSLTDGDFNLF